MVEKPKGIRLPCPKCMEATASIYLSLSDLNTCRCHDCEEEFTVTDMRGMVAEWQRFIAWLDGAGSP